MVESKKAEVTELLKTQFKAWGISEEYEPVQTVGKGSYGNVIEAVHIPSGKRVAIKRIDDVFESRLKAKRMLREITLLRQLQSEYIVRIVDVIIPQGEKEFDVIYVVMDLAEWDMKKLIASEAYLENSKIQRVVYKLLCGLKYMHSAQVLHRDLKPGNVLVNKDGSIKICDFGLARSITGLKSTE